MTKAVSPRMNTGKTLWATDGDTVMDTFRFLTIYDPRSATDYQCGVKLDCKLGQILRDTNTKIDGAYNSKLSIEQFMVYVNEAIDKDMILTWASNHTALDCHGVQPTRQTRRSVGQL